MIEHKEAFIKAESDGRKKAMTVLNSINLFDSEFSDYSIKPTEHSCNWDFEIIDNQTNEVIGIIEAKDRKFPSTDNKLKYGGAQLEANKFELLKNISKVRDLVAFYLCTFTDDTYYIWNITECKGITEDKRMCNRTTAVLTEKIEKHCYYFPMNNAVFNGNI